MIKHDILFAIKSGHYLAVGIKTLKEKGYSYNF